MPAIQVYKTDTFDALRLKINDIAQTVFDFAEGTDFATSTLKLGDGSVSTPSLAFATNTSLGLYKESSGTLGFVSNNKKTFSISDEQVYSFKSLIAKQRSLSNADIRILDKGTGYDAGFFTNISLLGGSGSGAKVNLSVVAFIGTVTNQGKNYIAGTYTNRNIFGGNGLGARASFVVDGIQGTITPGQDYDAGAYENISLSGGSGTGILVNIVVDSNGTVSEVSIVNPGLNYENGDVLVDSSGILGFTGTGFQYTITSFPGIIRNFSFTNYGIDYQTGDNLSLRSAVENLAATVQAGSFDISLSLTPEQGSASDFIRIGDRVYQQNGLNTRIRTNTKVTSVSDTSITVDRPPIESGPITIMVTPDYGKPTTPFSYQIGNLGEITDLTVVDGGSGYFRDDLLSVNQTDLTFPIEYEVQNLSLQSLVFSTPPTNANFPVGGNLVYNGINYKIWGSVLSGSFVQKLFVEYAGIFNGAFVYSESDSETPYGIAEASDEIFRWAFEDYATGDYTLFPNIVFRPNQSYRFLFAEDPEHTFSLSKYPGGIWGRGLVEGVSVTLDIASNIITVPSGLELFEGMVVTSTGTGSVVTGTTIESINGTSVTLSENPLSSGSATLTFRGVEYAENTFKTPTSLLINVTELTPDLYVYCSNTLPQHANEGGDPNEEILITNNLSNPRTNFGSGFSAEIANIEEIDVIKLNPDNGSIQSSSVNAVNDISASSGSFSGTVTSNLFLSQQVNTKQILSTSDVTLTTQTFFVNSNIDVNGAKITIDRNNGNFESVGTVKSITGFNSNDQLTIVDNTIGSNAGYDIVLQPATSRIAKVSGSTAFVIPVGNTAQRPSVEITETGAIRFNTDTAQYEGFDASTTSWTSLGGVRDVDGNTYILAESFSGANENVIFFYNNNNNTLRLSENFLDFRSVKKIRSENMSAPEYTMWTPNADITDVDDNGDPVYIGYKKNVYQVTASGRTGGPGSGPTHGSDNPVAVNGTATLTWVALRISDLIFEEITAVKVDPLGTTPLEINDELVLSNNTISTKNEDLLISPFEGKKVVASANSSFVVPVGTSNQRGAPSVGSIRYNTDFLSYEGYNGTNWTSLGGVKDVDGNTYIIPESSPGANENILYFYNNSSNTLQLTTSRLVFKSVNTISSDTSLLKFEVPTVNFNTNNLIINNTSTSEVVISTNKPNIDLKLSSGLQLDTFIRLSDDGSLNVNTEYGNPSPSYVKFIDKNLKRINMIDYETYSELVQFISGTVDAGSFDLYDNTIYSGARVTVTTENSTQNKKEMIEFSVTDDGTNVVYSEFGNIYTEDEIVVVSFALTGSTIALRIDLTGNNADDDVLYSKVIVTLIRK